MESPYLHWCLLAANSLLVVISYVNNYLLFIGHTSTTLSTGMESPYLHWCLLAANSLLVVISYVDIYLLFIGHTSTTLSTGMELLRQFAIARVAYHHWYLRPICWLCSFHIFSSMNRDYDGLVCYGIVIKLV